MYDINAVEMQTIKFCLLLSIACIFVASLPFLYNRFFHTAIKKNVLAEQTIDDNRNPAKAPAQTKLTKKPSPEPTDKLSKKSYTIAVFGDSMVDTMGERLEYLEHNLTEKYPGIEFKLYNYGIPSQNVEHGFERFHKAFSFRDRNYPPITQINADIIILGSFAYNPFPPHNRDRHWTGLIKLTEEAKKTPANVYILAEIAPLKEEFGKGPNGPNWTPENSIDQSNHIIEQLENAVALSQALNVPLIDSFTKSKEDGKYGKKLYVDPNDGIHPSIAGQTFTAKIIADTIKLE